MKRFSFLSHAYTKLEIYSIKPGCLNSQIKEFNFNIAVQLLMRGD